MIKTILAVIGVIFLVLHSINLLAELVLWRRRQRFKVR